MLSNKKRVQIDVPNPHPDFVTLFVDINGVWQQKLENGSIIPLVPTGTGGFSAYEHTQTTPASIWTIPHNLNRMVSVTTKLNDGTIIEGDINIIDTNNLEISFFVAGVLSPISGTAYIV